MGKQAEWEDRQRIRQEKQAEWEDRQRTIAEDRERNRQEQQKKLAEWEDRQKTGQEKERKAKKEHDEQASTRTSSPCPTGHGDSTVHKIPMKKIAAYNKNMPGWEVPLSINQRLTIAQWPETPNR